MQGGAFCLLAQVAWMEDHRFGPESRLQAAEDLAARAGAGAEAPLGRRIVNMRERVLGVRPP